MSALGSSGDGGCSASDVSMGISKRLSERGRRLRKLRGDIRDSAFDTNGGLQSALIRLIEILEGE